MLRNCKPDIIVDRMEDLDQDELWNSGIRGLIFDLDNTLCPYHSSEITPERMEWLQRARSRFKMCILSNTFKYRRLRRVGDKIGIPGIGRWLCGRKPGRGGVSDALKIMGTKPEESAIIGDQVFADVLAGNRSGLTTILMRRLDPCEFITTKMIRGIERVVLRRVGCEVPEPCAVTGNE
ncbi:MAG: YqeG family HAD IIIA-type phosphatase [Armatimonadia bacterium]